MGVLSTFLVLEGLIIHRHWAVVPRGNQQLDEGGALEMARQHAPSLNGNGGQYFHEGQSKYNPQVCGPALQEGPSRQSPGAGIQPLPHLPGSAATKGHLFFLGQSLCPLVKPYLWVASA